MYIYNIKRLWNLFHCYTNLFQVFSIHIDLMLSLCIFLSRKISFRVLLYGIFILQRVIFNVLERNFFHSFYTRNKNDRTAALFRAVATYFPARFSHRANAANIFISALLNRSYRLAAGFPIKLGLQIFSLVYIFYIHLLRHSLYVCKLSNFFYLPITSILSRV